MDTKHDITPEVAQRNKSDIAITETDYWQWLTKHYHNFKFVAHMNYLEDQYQYLIGRDKVAKETVDVLSIIYDHYTRTVMHPQWEADRALYNETMRTP